MTISIQKDALLAQFSVLAYKDQTYLNDAANLPTGWLLKASDVLTPPFAAFAFKNEATGEVIIAYRGTDGLRDAPADAAILLGAWDAQFAKGLEFVKSVRDNTDIFNRGTTPVSCSSPATA